MKWLKNAWKWLDGKKTAIGTVCLIAANYIPPDKTAHIILSIAGQVLGGTGVAHKFKKSETIRKLPSGLSQMKNNIKKYWDLQ